MQSVISYAMKIDFSVKSDGVENAIANFQIFVRKRLIKLTFGALKSK